MNREPHYRAYEAIAVLEEGKTPSDEKVAAIVAAVRQDPGCSVPLSRAWALFERESSRVPIDAFLLAGARYTAINQALGIPIEVLQAYHEYLFDTSVLENHLDAYCYVNDVRRYMDPNNALFLQTAITTGPEALQWLWSAGIKKRIRHAPTEVMELLMVEHLYKSLSTKHAPITSEVSKAGLEHSRAALQAATALQRLNPMEDQDALAELKLALAHEDRTISAQTEGAPRPEDILH